MRNSYVYFLKWSHVLIKNLVPEAVMDRDVFNILKFTCDTSNEWFRSLYRFGTWIPAHEAKIILEYGWPVADSWL